MSRASEYRHPVFRLGDGRIAQVGERAKDHQQHKDGEDGDLDLELRQYNPEVPARPPEL